MMLIDKPSCAWRVEPFCWRHARRAFAWAGLLVTLLAVLVPVPAKAATIRDDQPDASYLALANRPEYAPVGRFVNDWGYTGCGTLIAPNWVLTAGHMFSAASAGTFTLNDVAYATSRLVTHPGWHAGGTFNGYDLAVTMQ